MNTETSVKGTLLIVDDIPDNVKVLLKFLIDEGFKVLVAREGEQGIQIAERAQPDLILLDIMMPGMDGFEVCQYLKSNPKTLKIPIIFMTALTDTVDKVKGFELGADDYITKPFQQEEVLARITTHLNLRKTQWQLQEQTQELEKRNMELDAFAHTVAHDLKNPVSGVMGIAEWMIECFTSDPQLKEWEDQLQLLLQASHQMLNIIDALLLLAGVSRQAQNIEIHTLDMGEILRQVFIRQAAFIKKFKGEILLPDTWPVAQGYAPWIQEVWTNYISNGLKYGGQPPQLELGADTQDNGLIRFWVRDNGHGLTPEAQAQLFTPFTRLHQKRVEGHGLGLSIVKHIVEKVGGAVGVESQLGQGSLFYFTLPAAQ